jgi:ribonuclease-3
VTTSRYAALETRLGHRFASPALLEQALTHRSYGALHNERLEFLGDGVLDCAVADELYRLFAQLPEGKLTQLRAGLVRKEALVEVGGHLRLQEFIRVGPNAPVADSILADALEAVIAAIFLDGGYAAARSAVVMVFKPLLERIDPHKVLKDAKTQLQEIMQAGKHPLPEYRLLPSVRNARKNTFEIECVIAGFGLSARGSGASRQQAEQQAAQALLEKLA